MDEIESKNDTDSIIPIAKTEVGDEDKVFGIKKSDRTRHIYIIGKPEMGKSVLMKNMAINDIRSGNGVAFIDTSGKTAESLLDYIPKSRASDVFYIEPFSLNKTSVINIFDDVDLNKHEFVAQSLVEAFANAWSDEWSARFHHILYHTTIALLEYPSASLADMSRMFTEQTFRDEVLAHTIKETTKTFWKKEFVDESDKLTLDAVAIIKSKMNKFISRTYVCDIVCEPKSSLDILDIVDNKKILIVNLSKKDLGKENAGIIGTIINTKISLALMKREDLSTLELLEKPNFYLYLDDFPAYSGKTFTDVISGARKLKLNLNISHKYIEEVPEEVRSVIFGNIGTMIVFRLGTSDANIFEKEFAPNATSEDMASLKYGQIYLRLTIDDIVSEPFFATILPPIKTPKDTNSRLVLVESHKQLEQDIEYNNDKQKILDKKEENTDQTVSSVNTKKADIPNTKEQDKKNNTPFEKAFKNVGIINGIYKNDNEKNDEEDVRIQKPIRLNSLINKNGISTRTDENSGNINELKKIITKASRQLSDRDKNSYEKQILKTQKLVGVEKGNEDKKLEHDNEKPKSKTYDSDNIDSSKEIPEKVLKKILE